MRRRGGQPAYSAEQPGGRNRQITGKPVTQGVGQRIGDLYDKLVPSAFQNGREIVAVRPAYTQPQIDAVQPESGRLAYFAEVDPAHAFRCFKFAGIADLSGKIRRGADIRYVGQLLRIGIFGVECKLFHVGIRRGLDAEG